MYVCIYGAHTYGCARVRYRQVPGKRGSVYDNTYVYDASRWKIPRRDASPIILGSEYRARTMFR